MEQAIGDPKNFLRLLDSYTYIASFDFYTTELIMK